MAKPQLENGYIRIANELYDAIARAGFNGTQRAILDTVIRYTYGYNRKEAKIAVSSISQYTKKDRINTTKELNKLINRKIIDVVSSDAQGIRILKINKNYNEWLKNETEFDAESVVENDNCCQTQHMSNSTTECCQIQQQNCCQIRQPINTIKTNIKTISNNSKKIADENIKKAIQLYEQNIGVPSPIVRDVLRDILSSHSTDLLELAIQEAVKANAKSINYIEGIFRNWDNAGVKTVESAKFAISEHQSKKLNAVSAKNKQNENNPKNWGYKEI